MHTCSKLYTDLPAAHRQPNHGGHCRLVHGHNWSFEFTFTADELDSCGFVIDFGGLRKIKNMLEHLFDHTLLIEERDPRRFYFEDMQMKGLATVIIVPSASAEGLAKLVFGQAHTIVHEMTSGRVSVLKVTCYEDLKNSATYAA